MEHLELALLYPFEQEAACTGPPASPVVTWQRPAYTQGCMALQSTYPSVCIGAGEEEGSRCTASCDHFSTTARGVMLWSTAPHHPTPRGWCSCRIASLATTPLKRRGGGGVSLVNRHGPAPLPPHVLPLDLATLHKLPHPREYQRKMVDISATDAASIALRSSGSQSHRVLDLGQWGRKERGRGGQGSCCAYQPVRER